MSIRSRLGAWAAALTLVVAACTGSAGPGPDGFTPPRRSPSPVPTGKGSAAAALAKLCVVPKTPPASGVTPEGPTPPAIAEVEREVEGVRGLKFMEPVGVDPVTHEQLVQKLDREFNRSFPDALYARRSQAWRTIGAIPPGSDIRRSLVQFQSGQVIGFYDPASKELVFIGTKNPTPIQRIALAHELTHAIDDQHFGLLRLDSLDNHCQDEASAAALGAVEGSAQFFSVEVARRFLSLQEQLGLLNVPVPSVSGIPPFIVQLEEWPYTAGFAFMTALDDRGGLQAVNQALTGLPVSTEQVIHPERYPSDVPQPVNVPNLEPKLGKGWIDLDVMEVGEAWLAILLGLRLDADAANTAAAGWGGSIYRAWSNGNRVAVVLSTVWDTANDAQEFSGAMQKWIAAGAGQQALVLPAQGERVDVLFASDAATLAALESAAA